MAAIEKDFKRSVVYQIYIKSFCDSDGDGVGDLPGITSKLDYLAHLGVDYLWITPFFPSPQADGGYDISDYCAIDPVYGTMDDFDELVREAHARDLGVMLDMVLCHTSSEHAWFQRALAGDGRYRRYYILRDGRGSTGAGDPGEPPTNWQCAFGGSAWEWEPRLGKWYLHMHDVSQPDLDWTNPEVRAACANVVRFWRERGVDGFRFDVVSLISKPEVFEDTPDGSCRSLVADGPHVHEYLRELVAASGIDGMLTVGEMAATTLENCILYTAPERHELTQTFSFHHLKVDYADGDKWKLMEPDIARLREILRSWQEGMQAGGGWNALFWDNHDQPRAITRFGGREGAGERGGSWERVGRMLAICSFTLQGTPYIFQGDELGMTNAGYPSIDCFADVESTNNYRILMEGGATAEEALHVVNERSRDNGRTPMQWTSGPHAGFTTGTPWLAVPENHVLVNAEAEVGVAGSLFEFYRELVRLRHELPVLAEGIVRFLDAGAQAPKVIAFERTLGDARLVTVCSFDSEPSRATGLDVDGARYLIGSYDDAPVSGADGALELRPYEAAVFLS
ncbi:alpha,alpha-phosphotrehalase [Collinsella ihumii]|uniref:Alpha,alpha-phosphotrehalase n=1 Tax=Collinsella ihumii TaxID=1720204 RepID=A0ABT7XED9_9ACTN|nr:alpha,alpha-phosphotrehalase [Collinsella ihumii]MDN0063769.1 alpha,alpha-phosphotrehalase [Collinsella ihumii]